MRNEITIVYNDPCPGTFKDAGEEKAVLGIIECVDAVQNALKECGYTVYRLSLFPPVNSVKKQLEQVKTELIFNLFEGFFDDSESEPEVTSIIEDMNFIYTGCPPEALYLALDKAKSKLILANNGINVPKFRKINPKNINKFNLSFPCIVKPLNQDASHGISKENVVNDYESLKRQVFKICEFFGTDALIEEFLPGREFNISVLGDRELSTLPISEIIYELPPELPRVLTFEAKWFPETDYFKGTKVVCPAEINDKLRSEIENIAISAFKIFKCRGYARIDLRLDDKNIVKVIEVNPNPDISPDTGAARQAIAAGMTYNQFIDKIVQYALERVYA